MRKFLPYVNLIVSLGAITLSVIAISNVYPRNVNLGFDYLGFIIGILGIIVAVLIGWQLFNAFNLKEYSDQAKKAKDEAFEAKEKVLKEVNIINSQLDQIKIDLSSKLGRDELQPISSEDFENMLK